jgi:hypothetical protein
MGPLIALPDQKRMESTSDFRYLSESHMFVKKYANVAEQITNAMEA